MNCVENRLTRTKISNGYVTRYEWDFRNRLTKVTEEDNANTVLQVTENGYDAFNQWIRRSYDADGAGVTAAVDTFLAHENGQIVLQFEGDAAADLSHRYLWGETVDQLFADEAITSLASEGNVIWPLGDHLGTQRDLVTYNSGTDDATVANHREYDSYGSLTNESNSAVDLLFGYTSRPFDETAGLQNNLNRWYDPNVGRWISEDPIGFSANDTNLQRYALNNPLKYTDPSGLENEPLDPSMPTLDQLDERRRQNRFNLAAEAIIDKAIDHLRAVREELRAQMAEESAEARANGWYFSQSAVVSWELNVKTSAMPGDEDFPGAMLFGTVILKNQFLDRMRTLNVAGGDRIADGMTIDEIRPLLDQACHEEIVEREWTYHEPESLGAASIELLGASYDYARPVYETSILDYKYEIEIDVQVDRRFYVVKRAWERE